MRQVFYQKMRVLVQNATVITNRDNSLQIATVVTKCDVYYTLQQYKQVKVLKIQNIMKSQYFYKTFPI